MKMIFFFLSKIAFFEVRIFN